MLQGLPRRPRGLVIARPRWLRSERAVSNVALATAALGFGLSLLIAALGR